MRLGTVLSLLAAAVAAPAWAYLDPGTGSMVLQLLLAGLAGLGVLWRLSWRRLSLRWSKRRGAPPGS